MSRVTTAVDLRSSRSIASPAKILAPAPSCAQLAQPFVGGLGGASSLPLLAGLMMGSGSFLAGGL